MKDSNCLNQKPDMFSNLISHIKFFNRTNVEFSDIVSSVICNHFSYDTNTDDQKKTYFDQDKALLYPYLLSFCQWDSDDMLDDEGNSIGEKQFIKFVKNREVLESVTCEKSTKYKDSATGWYRTGPNFNHDAVSEMSSTIKEIKFDDNSKKLFEILVQNFLDYCHHITDKEVCRKLQALNKVIQEKKNSFTEKMNEIEDQYNEHDKKEDYTENDKAKYNLYEKQRDQIKKWEIVPSRPGIFVTLTLLVHHSYASVSSESFTIEQWTEGVFDVLKDYHEEYFVIDELIKMKSSDWARMKKIFQKCHTNKLRKRVRAYLSNKNKSLWTRAQKKKIINEVYGWREDRLYYCPHQLEWVTIENHEGHHLYFRSNKSKKDSEFFFPLSRGYNNYISDNSDKNLITGYDEDGNPTGENAVNAFDYMIKKIEDAMVTYQVKNPSIFINFELSLIFLKRAKQNLVLWLEKRNNLAA